MDGLADVLSGLVRLYRQSQRQASLTLGLTPFAAEVLEQAAKMDQATLNDLSSALGFDPSWVSRGVQALVEKGFLTRRTGEDDRRSVRIGLTKKGRRTAAALAGRMQARVAALAPGLGARETEALSALCAAWRHDYAAEPVASGAPAGRVRPPAAPALQIPPVRETTAPVRSDVAAAREERLPPSLL